MFVCVCVRLFEWSVLILLFFARNHPYLYPWYTYKTHQYVYAFTKTVWLNAQVGYTNAHTPNWLRHGASMVTNGSVYNMVSFWFIIFPVQPFIECKHLSDVNNKHFCVLFHWMCRSFASSKWMASFCCFVSSSLPFPILLIRRIPLLPVKNFTKHKCHCCCLIKEIIHWNSWKLAISLN